MAVMASSDGQKRDDFPKSTAEIVLVDVRSFFFRNYACGHKGSRKFSISLFGGKLKTISQKRHCSNCFLNLLKKVAIRCAVCGFGIMPGDGVAVYSAENEFLAGVMYTKTENKGVIGCMRMNCCPTGGFFAGHWTENGFKPAFENGMSAVEKCMATEKVVIGNI